MQHNTSYDLMAVLKMLLLCNYM